MSRQKWAKAMWAALFTRNGVKKVRRSDGGKKKRQNGKKVNVRERESGGKLRTG